MRASEVKEIRKRLGLTQRGFAEKLCVSLRSVTGWEIGEHEPLPLYERAIRQLEKRATRKAA